MGFTSFRITSYGRVAKGIAKVKGDVIRGLISNRVYVTERSAKTVWRLKAYRYGYASETQGVSMATRAKIGLHSKEPGTETQAPRWQSKGYGFTLSRDFLSSTRSTQLAG